MLLDFLSMAEPNSCNIVLCCQVYLHWVRAILQLESACCNLQGSPHRLQFESSVMSHFTRLDLRQNFFSGSIFHNSLQVIFLGVLLPMWPMQAPQLCILTACVCLCSSSGFFVSCTKTNIFCLSSLLYSNIVCSYHILSLVFQHTPI